MLSNDTFVTAEFIKRNIIREDCHELWVLKDVKRDGHDLFDDITRNWRS